MSKINKEIGQLVRDYRQRANMTQLELANKLGYESMQFVSLFERGLSKVPDKIIGKCVVILGIPEKKIVKTLTDEFVTKLVSGIDEGKRLAGGVPEKKTWVA